MLVTNFGKEKYGIYKEAVELYRKETGDVRLYVDKNAYVKGIKYEEMCALRIAWSMEDLTRFWSIFDIVESRYIREGKYDGRIY